jgi:uncharacterized protein (TIGR02466 family)
MDLLNIFPTSLGIFNLDRELTVEEKQFILNLPKRKNRSNETSVSSYLLNFDQLQNLKIFFDNSLKQYFNFVYNPLHECSLRITQSWCNYAENGESHPKHSHSNSLVSGVFYVQTSEKDKIVFHRNIFNDQLVVEPKEHNMLTAPTWWLPAKQCSLILFPSLLEHSVDPDSRNETRVSLAFNTFFSGTIGSSTSLTELIIS